VVSPVVWVTTPMVVPVLGSSVVGPPVVSAVVLSVALALPSVVVGGSLVGSVAVGVLAGVGSTAVLLESAVVPLELASVVALPASPQAARTRPRPRRVCAGEKGVRRLLMRARVSVSRVRSNRRLGGGAGPQPGMRSRSRPPGYQ
jgi:hypothetical protein